MPSRRVIKSVLDSFLGTFTSRYADFGGYWLHGQLPLNSVEIFWNLLGTPDDALTVPAYAHRLAIKRFKEQLTKSGLDTTCVKDAHLKVFVHTDLVTGRHGNYQSKGHIVDFIVLATMDNGRNYERSRSVFIAPHDPRKERQRLPKDQLG